MQQISQFFVSDDCEANKDAHFHWHADLMKYVTARCDGGDLEKWSDEGWIVLAKPTD